MPDIGALAEDLKAAVQRYRPDWTDVGARDPGTTLIEVFTFLGEELLLRANQIPERVRARLVALGSRLERQWAYPVGAPALPGTGFKRVRYFDGQFLSVDDLTTEQSYFREKQRLRNRLLVGWGIVSGLEVSVGKTVVTVSPGVALDPDGNEVIVGAPVDVTLPVRGTTMLLSLKYRETETDPVSVSSGTGLEASRVQEGYGLDLAAAPSPAVIPIAKLVWRSSRWSLDRRFRARRVK